MAPSTEGGSNGHGRSWRTTGSAVRTAVGGRRRVSAAGADEPARCVSRGERPTLQAILERGGSLPAAPALLVLDDVLATLERLHAAGITHGHLRPAIVVVGSEGRSRLEEGIPPPAPGSAASGLLGYLAPEVRSGRPATPQADVYSATAVFLEALTNLPPLGGVDQARRDVSVPVFARGLLEEGLHPDPQRRPQSAARLRADIAVAGDAFLDDDWRSRGRAWLTAASRAIESGADVAGAVQSPWARPRRPERDLPAASDARPQKPRIGMSTAAAAAPWAAAAAAAKPDSLLPTPGADLTSPRADALPSRSEPMREETSPAEAAHPRTDAALTRTPRGTLRDTFATRTAAVGAAAAGDELSLPQTDGGDRRRSRRMYAGIALGGAGVLALGLVGALVLHGTPAPVPPSHFAPVVTTPSPSPSPSVPVFGFNQQFNTPPPTATPSPSPTPTPSARPTVLPGTGVPTAAPTQTPAPTPSPTSCFLIICN